MGSDLYYYTRGNDLSGSLEGAGGIGGLLSRSHQYSSGTLSTQNHYHADGNGNVTYLVNSGQTWEAVYRYDPYGRTMSQAGALATGNVYRCSSKEVHTQSGMYYYGYRFYDPHLQRWPNRDPLMEHGSINMYEYAESSPVSVLDPHGLCSQVEIDTLAAALGNTYELPTRIIGEEFCGILCCDCRTGKPYAAPVQRGRTVAMGPGQPSWKICSTANSRCKEGDKEVGRWHTQPAGSDRQIDPGKDYNIDLEYPRQAKKPSYMTNSKGETTVIWPIGDFLPELVIDPPRRKLKSL